MTSNSRRRSNEDHRAFYRMRAQTSNGMGTYRMAEMGSADHGGRVGQPPRKILEEKSIGREGACVELDVRKQTRPTFCRGRP